MLMLATLVWGGSFVITHQAVQSVPPLVFVALRFTVAALLVGVLSRPRLARLTAIELRAGALLGTVMFGGYGLQAMGMQLGVGSGRAAFISALYVPMVPLLQWKLLGRRPARATWIGLGLACGGLMLLAGPLGHAQLGAGEGLVLLGAMSVAGEILLIGGFARQVDARRLAIVECSMLACVCLLVMGMSGQAWPAPRADWILCALLLGTASAGLQISVNWAQRFVAPARATLIYSLEPVWAAGFGLLAGERMGLAAVAGAGLILMSLVVNSRAGAGHPVI